MMTRKIFGSHFVLALAILAACPILSLAADRVFSGPQPNEPTTPFKVAVVTGVGEGSERDPIAENKGAPTALVFIHTVERSLVPLLRVIDQYGSLRKNNLKTEVIFLVADRVAGEQRLKATANSLRLQSAVGFSLDGAEGPKRCQSMVLSYFALKDFWSDHEKLLTGTGLQEFHPPFQAYSSFFGPKKCAIYIGFLPIQLIQFVTFRNLCGFRSSLFVKFQSTK